MDSVKAVVLCMLLALGAAPRCAAGDEEEGGGARPAEEEEVSDPGAATAGNSRFALDLFGRLRAEDGAGGAAENLFFSPYSLSAALAMTFAGARGETEAQMAEALHFPLPQDRLHPAFGRLQQELEGAAAAEDGPIVEIANALWAQAGVRFLESFLAAAREHYGAAVEEVDFKTAAEDARRIINAWVEQQTNGKIKELIQPGVLDALTELVLTNAIYFKGTWASAFKIENTHKAPFRLGPEKEVMVELMSQKGEFPIAVREDLQILELPYTGGRLSMVIVLPKEIGGLDAVEDGLSLEALGDWLGALRRRDVLVEIPRFKMTREFRLSETLRAMGMTSAFSGNADFSGMTGDRRLFLSEVVHKAFVEVNEEGTEAAAATGAVMKRVSMPREPIVFRADHPFLFLIRDAQTGSILFMGRMAQPGGPAAAK